MRSGLSSEPGLPVIRRAATVNFGSAHLMVGGMPESLARALLEEAVRAGAGRLDTAPLYGHGRSEPLVAAIARAHGIAATTKVGLEPTPPPAPWRRAVGAVASRLPPQWRASLKHALRPGAPTPSQAEGPSGRFAPDAVRNSIERSLARFGRLDRLLLHEVHPADITPELLTLLGDYQRRGDVDRLGIATGNAVTTDALERSCGLFDVAHVSLDPLGAAPPPDAALHRSTLFVGHGALGPEGRTLASLHARLASDAEFATQWAQLAAGTPYESADGAAGALLAYATDTFAGELIIASSRAHRIAAAVEAASGSVPLPARLAGLIDDAFLLERASRRSPSGDRPAQAA